MSGERDTEDPERVEGIASESRPSRAKDLPHSGSTPDATSPAQRLRAAVEWLSAKDTRRMVQHGLPGAVYQTMRQHRTDKPRRVEHHRVIAETEPAEVLAMCDWVEQEGTSGPDIFAMIDAKKAGRELTRPHDDESL